MTDVNKTWPCRARGQIPNLPKKEVPEAGYRALRAWLLDNLGHKIDSTKTTSQIILDILEHAAKEGLLETYAKD